MTDTRYDHLSKETQVAIAIFARHHHKQFYTGRMIRLETETMAAVPESELAEFVRITTEIQNAQE